MVKFQRFNMIKHILMIIFLISILPVDLFSQKTSFNEQAFFSRIKTSYYNLSETGVKNFVALVTSAKTEQLAKEIWDNAEVFPLQLIWFNPNKLYMSQRGVPKIPKEKQKEYQEAQQGLKMQLRGVLVDLQRFYLNGIYESISPDYILQHNEEAVQLTFSSGQDSLLAKVKYLFGENGLLLMIQIDYPQTQKQIVIYPRFKTVKTKWLCTGWSVQNYILNEVESGFDITLTNRLEKGLWVPGSLLIEVQKAETKGQKYYDEIKLKNYLFNQSIQFEKQPGHK